LDWPAVIASYQDWLKNFPTNDLRPQVEYALGRAEFQTGNETNALAAFSGFVTQFPTNRLAPVAQWWVADHYFRAGNWTAAETNYEEIFQTPAWKSSKLYFPAQLMAGRAAAGRLGFSDAERYFTAMTTDTNCPPKLATQALFAYGGVLMRWDSPDTNRPFLNFERATNVFMKLCQDNPTNELGPLAWSELGDCNLQLGAFDAATNAYWQVINSPCAGAGLHSRAQVGLGRVLEKMAELAPPDERKALQNQALNLYLDVLYTDPGAADPFWAKKAGLQALPLMTALKNGDADKFIDRLEYWLPPLKDALEKKRASLKN
jgi:tetratricopeptide (TPR) repeat protein